MSVCDLADGDMFTVAVLTPPEMRQPHALLACHREATMTVHLPFEGPAVAQHHAATSPSATPPSR